MRQKGSRILWMRVGFFVILCAACQREKINSPKGSVSEAHTLIPSPSFQSFSSDDPLVDWLQSIQQQSWAKTRPDQEPQSIALGPDRTTTIPFVSAEKARWVFAPYRSWLAQTHIQGAMILLLSADPKTPFRQGESSAISEWLKQIPPPRGVELRVQSIAQPRPGTPPPARYNPFLVNDEHWWVQNPYVNPPHRDVCQLVANWIHSHQLLLKPNKASKNRRLLYCHILWSRSPQLPRDYLILTRLALPYHRDQFFPIVTEDQALSLSAFQQLAE